MRLVDADELPWIDKLIVLEKWDGDIRAEIKDNASYVDENTPTVKAIPVEWIKKFIDGLYWENEKEVVEYMLESWEAENETD